MTKVKKVTWAEPEKEEFVKSDDCSSLKEGCIIEGFDLNDSSGYFYGYESDEPDQMIFDSETLMSLSDSFSSESWDSEQISDDDFVDSDTILQLIADKALTETTGENEERIFEIDIPDISNIESTKFTLSGTSLFSKTTPCYFGKPTTKFDSLGSSYEI